MDRILNSLCLHVLGCALTISRSQSTTSGSQSITYIESYLSFAQASLNQSALPYRGSFDYSATNLSCLTISLFTSYRNYLLTLLESFMLSYARTHTDLLTYKTTDFTTDFCFSFRFHHYLRLLTYYLKLATYVLYLLGRELIPCNYLFLTYSSLGVV